MGTPAKEEGGRGLEGLAYLGGGELVHELLDSLFSLGRHALGGLRGLSLGQFSFPLAQVLSERNRLHPPSPKNSRFRHVAKAAAHQPARRRRRLQKSNSRVLAFEDAAHWSKMH